MEEAAHPDHRVPSEEREGDGGVVQVDFAGGEGSFDRPREGLDVDLEPEGERGRGRQPGSHPSVGVPRDRFVQSDRVPPERLVPEGVEAEGVSTFVDHPGGKTFDGVAASGRGPQLGGGRPGPPGREAGRVFAGDGAGGHEERKERPNGWGGEVVHAVGEAAAPDFITFGRRS